MVSPRDRPTGWVIGFLSKARDASLPSSRGHGQVLRHGAIPMAVSFTRQRGTESGRLAAQRRGQFLRGDVSYWSRPCENVRVQFARRKFFSIWSICKPKLLTTAIRGGQRRNRSTLSWRTHVFTRPGSLADRSQALRQPRAPIKHPCHETRAIPFWRLSEARTPAFAYRRGSWVPLTTLLWPLGSDRSELIRRYRVDRDGGHD